MTIRITTLIVAIFLFIVYSIAVYKLGSSNERVKYISQVDTLTTYQTIKDTVIVPEFRTETHLDTIILTDTTYVLETKEYIAKIDSIYEDDLAHLKVEYISDIPLSKKSYFNLDLKVKKEVVFVPTKMKESFWDNRFAPFLGVGLSYNGKTIEPALQLGFGIRIN